MLDLRYNGMDNDHHGWQVVSFIELNCEENGVKETRMKEGSEV
jgi:hypothetical protein